jgi:hypothetical protein
MNRILVVVIALLSFGCAHATRVGSAQPPQSERKVSDAAQNIVLQEGVWLRASQLGPDDTVLCGNIGYVTQWGIVDFTAMNVAACNQKYQSNLARGASCLPRKNVGFCQILTYQDWMNLPQIAVYKKGQFVEERKAGASFDDITNEIQILCQTP